MASSSVTFTHEWRLLVCCARVDLPPALAEEIRGLAAAPLDWDLILRAGDENGLVPLLARHLPTFAPQMPERERERLQSTTRSSTARALTLTAELLKLLALFESASILAIPYKGPVLAVQACGNLALRQFEDIDVVIRQRDAARAHEIISGLGYRLRPTGAPSPSATSAIPGEYSYRDDARQLIAELHTERTLRHFPVAPDLDILARRLVPVRLSGHEVKTLAPEEGLTFLCVHGSKDFWARLSWVADVAELVRSHPALDWDTACRFAESLSAGRMLSLGLTLAGSVLDAPLPPEISARVERDIVAQALALTFQKQFSGPAAATGEQGPAARFHFRRRLVAGPLRGWQYAARLTLAPAQDDFAAAHLPGPLAPLHFLLRPFRLLRKYRIADQRSPQG